MAIFPYRTLLSILALVLLLTLPGCTNDGYANSPGQPDAGPGTTGLDVEISVTLKNAPNGTLVLYDIYGQDFLPLITIATTEGNNAYTIRGRIPAPGLYLLAMQPTGDKANPAGVKVLLNKDERNLKITADATNIAGTSTFGGSSLNTDVLKFYQETEALQVEINQAQEKWYAAAMQNSPSAPEAKKIADELYAKREILFNTYAARKDPLGQMAKRYTFTQQPQGDTRKPETYFIEEFLKTINLKDTTEAYYPVYYNKCYSFASMLVTQLDVSYDQIEAARDLYLKQIPAGSRSQRLYLLGFLYASGGARRTNPNWQDLYASASEAYVNAFPNDPLSGQLKNDLASLGNVRIGKAAPEIEQPNPGGQPLKLSSLKGKIVLLDFWASWCGPCRMENPNVVKAWNHYKDRGFEVFSVSLDQNKEKWLAAIEKDGLAWTWHVSDLKGWAAAPAKLYGVSSIPQTFLLDRNGKVIARNLRGPALDAKLKELMGE